MYFFDFARAVFRLRTNVWLPEASNESLPTCVKLREYSGIDNSYI